MSSVRRVVDPGRPLERSKSYGHQEAVGMKEKSVDGAQMKRGASFTYGDTARAQQFLAEFERAYPRGERLVRNVVVGQSSVPRLESGEEDKAKVYGAWGIPYDWVGGDGKVTRVSGGRVKTPRGGGMETIPEGSEDG